MNDSDAKPPWYWVTARVLAAIAGVAYGARHIPPAIDGIPFVQVIPALVLGGAAGLLVDAVRVAVAPEKYERSFIKIAAVALVVVVMHIAIATAAAIKRIVP